MTKREEEKKMKPSKKTSLQKLMDEHLKNKKLIYMVYCGKFDNLTILELKKELSKENPTK